MIKWPVIICLRKLSESIERAPHNNQVTGTLQPPKPYIELIDLCPISQFVHTLLFFLVLQLKLKFNYYKFIVSTVQNQRAPHSNS